VVCSDCRDGKHEHCRESRRQENMAGGVPLDEIELSASSWCDCQHQAPLKEEKDD
jgi:hypothetical protein